MWLPKEIIHLPVADAADSIAFYEALLAAVPTHRSAHSTVFDLESPPVVLTLEERPRGRRSTSRPGSARQPASPRVRNQWALVVAEPKHVGDAAIRLRRAGVQLWVQDEGIEARDPDGNAWRVRCVPAAPGRLILAPASAVQRKLRPVIAGPVAEALPGGTRARGGRRQ
jgi:catechol 2,3-dioxygenase-like lactoylglutathione lyase family enzyme